MATSPRLEKDDIIKILPGYTNHGGEYALVTSVGSNRINIIHLKDNTKNAWYVDRFGRHGGKQYLILIAKGH